MSALTRLNVGLIGAASRGGSFAQAVMVLGAKVHAVCDINLEGAKREAQSMGAPEVYQDYREMLDKSDIDAVVVGTPMQWHAPMAIDCLNRHKHVISEVTAAVSLEECRALVEAAARSRGIYMMGENYTYMKPNVLVRELVRRGLFGTVYYAEGEYLHELKGLNKLTPWRRHWQTGVDGVTYGSHSLGPILQWFEGQRVTRVCCEAGGAHYKDWKGELYHQESPVMLCKMSGGGLAKIRVDMVSDRPDAGINYQLQGTDGAYEASRAGPGDGDKIWLRMLSDNPKWMTLEQFMKDHPQYMPEIWRNPSEEAIKAGHGGGDYFELYDFIRAIRGEAPCPIGIHEAMDMTLPGLISQESIKQEGAWLPVPDSRAWVGRKAPMKAMTTDQAQAGMH